MKKILFILIVSLYFQAFAKNTSLPQNNANLLEEFTFACTSRFFSKENRAIGMKTEERSLKAAIIDEEFGFTTTSEILSSNDLQKYDLTGNERVTRVRINASVSPSIHNYPTFTDSNVLFLKSLVSLHITDYDHAELHVQTKDGKSVIKPLKSEEFHIQNNVNIGVGSYTYSLTLGYNARRVQYSVASDKEHCFVNKEPISFQ